MATEKKKEIDIEIFFRKGCNGHTICNGKINIFYKNKKSNRPEKAKKNTKNDDQEHFQVSLRRMRILTALALHRNLYNTFLNCPTPSSRYGLIWLYKK